MARHTTCIYYIALEGDSEYYTKDINREPYLIRTAEIDCSYMKVEIKARKIKQAVILLKVNEGLTNPKVMFAANASCPIVDGEQHSLGIRKVEC
jgi:hypothetical protein